MTTGKHRASILLRMTEAEKREIRRRAEALGISLSDSLRRRLGMNYSPPRIEVSAAVEEANR